MNNMAEINDHISRTEVYNLLNAIGGCGADIETDPYTYGWDKAIDAAIEEIGKLPAVEYTPVKYGEWKQNGHIFECSECDYSFDHEGYLPFFNYCPCCGAKMDGGEPNDQM